MFFQTQHLVIGIRLVTMNGTELDLKAGHEWRLAIWDENERYPESGREIGIGTLLPLNDPAFLTTTEPALP